MDQEELFVRVFVDGDDMPIKLSQSDVIRIFEELGVDKYFLALEKGRSKRLHWQAYCVGSKGLEQKMRSWLKDNGFRGNRHYSIKDRDQRGTAGLLSYLMKQGQFTHSGLEAEIINEATEMNARYREVDKQKKESTFIQLRNWLETCYVRSETGPGYWYKMVDRYHQNSAEMRKEQHPIELSDVVGDVVDWFAQRPGLASVPMIEGYATTMAMRFVNGFPGYLKRKIFERICPDEWKRH